jgi:hypothetical protein
VQVKPADIVEVIVQGDGQVLQPRIRRDDEQLLFAQVLARDELAFELDLELFQQLDELRRQLDVDGVGGAARKDVEQAGLRHCRHMLADCRFAVGQGPVWQRQFRLPSFDEVVTDFQEQVVPCQRSR